MKFLLIILFLTGLFEFALAQSEPGTRIAAKVIDEKSNAVEGATVSLLKAQDSTIVKINITAKDGSVVFEPVKPGTYLLSIRTIGYKTTYSNLITVSQDHQQIAVNTIQLQHNISQLSEVTVQAKKPFIEQQADRTVINVNSSIVSAGSTALEVLSRSPGVVVGQDDNISMKGKQGVIVMIDDKQTYLSATDLANLLRGMPANSIDKIELITNPSAKYDAAGSAGIINIKLKKDERYGTNGTFTFSDGQGRYNTLHSGLSLNYRKNDINIFGSYNYSSSPDFEDVNFNRRFYTNGSLDGGYTQNLYLKIPRVSNTLKTGMDYSPSKNTTLGIVFTGMLSHYDRNGTTTSDVLDSALQKTSSFKTQSQGINTLNNYASNFNFKHKIDTAGQVITADVDYAHFTTNAPQSYNTSYFNLKGTPSQPDSVLKEQQVGALNIYSVKADYVLPLRNHAKFEAGLKSSYVHEDNNLILDDIINNQAVFDTSKSNHFIYKENINALYANYSQSFEKYKIQLGLRAEQTISQGDQLTTENSFRKSYIDLFPNLFIDDQIDKQNDLSFTLDRRIDRPTYNQLNPFKFFLDPSFYVEGNPNLDPQLTWTGTLSYTFEQKYNISLSYSYTSANIITVLFPDPTASDVVIQQDRNLSNYYNYGLSFTVPLDITSWWNSTNNLNTYYNIYSGDLANTPLNKGLFAFDANTTNSFTISKTLQAEFDGSFVSGNYYGYIYVKHYTNLSAGLAHPILKGKGTLKLNATDILRTYYTVGSTSLLNYKDMFNKYTDSRFATIAFSYRFGNTKVAPARSSTGGAGDEKKRAGGN